MRHAFYGPPLRLRVELRVVRHSKLKSEDVMFRVKPQALRNVLVFLPSASKTLHPASPNKPAMTQTTDLKVCTPRPLN